MINEAKLLSLYIKVKVEIKIMKNKIDTMLSTIKVLPLKFVTFIPISMLNR